MKLEGREPMADFWGNWGRKNEGTDKQIDVAFHLNPVPFKREPTAQLSLSFYFKKTKLSIALATHLLTG